MTTPPDNTVTVLLAIITLIGMIATSIISAVVAIMTNNNKNAISAVKGDVAVTHALVDGATSKLIAITTEAARAQGVAAGNAGEKPQDAAIASSIANPTVLQSPIA